DVSDTESEADTVDDTDEESDEDVWYDAESTFGNSPEDSDSDDDDGIVLNYESDSESVLSYTAYVEEYNSSVQKVRPAVENLRPTPTDDEILDEFTNTEVTKCFADEAKVHFGYPTSHWSEFFLEDRVDPTFIPRTTGNLYAEAAEFILEHHAPYPGDESRWGATSSHRINVFQLDEETFEICDLESEQGSILLPAKLLYNPHFQLAP
ncbi:hypothetical protein V5O48_019469, partial [Marasmius crinis-equi]